MDLIGREADLDAIERKLEGRLVTVVGAGGVGKTMVARHLAERSQSKGGPTAVWVDLGWVTSAGEMTFAWTRALSPTGESLGSLVDAIDALGSVLLVIDNCEHLMGLISPIVEEVISSCEHARVLATSRDSLGIAGEQLWRLAGLTCPPVDAVVSDPDAFAAVRLFLDRAMQVRPDLVLDDSTLAEVAAICRLLDGNPLGLILAAGHLRAMSPSQLRTSVQYSNRLLSNRSATNGSRHASIDMSLRWSFDLLEPADQDVLVSLGAFPGEFDLEAARIVGGDGPTDHDVMMSIGRLVDHGLVDFDGENTYHLPFVVRRFALDAGEGTERSAAAYEAHARMVLGWAAAACEWGDRVAPALIDRRAVDLHAGLAWAMEHDARLADRSFASFGVVLHGTVRRQYCDWVAARTDHGLDWARAVGWLAILAPTDAEAVLDDALQRAERIAAEAADSHLERLIACTSTQRATRRGDLRPARRLVEAARLANDGQIVVASATTAALVAATLGLFDDATTLCAATKWACEQGGLPYAATGALLAEALMAQKSGRTALARSLIDDASSSAITMSAVLGVRATMAIDHGDSDGLDTVCDRLTSPSEAHGLVVRARATIGAHHLRHDFDAAIAVADDAIGVGPLEDSELLLVTAACRLRGGHRPETVLDALDRARRSISLIAEPCPAFEIILHLLHAQTCLIDDDLDGAGRHLYPALERARTHQQRLLTIDALETVADLSYRRGTTKPANTLRAACTRARSELEYHSTLLAPTVAFEPGPPIEAIGLDAAIALAMRTRGGRGRPSTGSASLTPTEIAVVDLVVAGRTNAEIATELIVSTATVKTHLTHVFAKLGVTNRTQLAVTIDRSTLFRPNGPAT